jgi:TonB family protein
MKDPGAILSAAAPYYNFSDASLKPWHIRAAYQFYDDKGNPAEQGTFEYWWASPKVYRSTWSRPSGTHTDWHTADGKYAYKSTGTGLNFFEDKLRQALIKPLPDAAELDPSKNRLELKDLKLGDVKFPCVELIPPMPEQGKRESVQLGLFPTYCFDPDLPALRISYSFGSLSIEFNQFVRTQGHYLAKEFTFAEGKRLILTANVDLLQAIAESDLALVPDPDARYPKLEQVPLSAGVTHGMLINKVTPVYPQQAKADRVSGTVVLQALIGREGAIHELHVVQAPSALLAASAMWAVSQWQYRPYVLNGDPVEVETTVNVIFALGN